MLTSNELFRGEKLVSEYLVDGFQKSNKQIEKLQSLISEERRYKVFEVFYRNSANQKLIKELEQLIIKHKFIDRASYNMMKEAKIANRLHFEIQENRSNYSEVMYNYSIILQNMSNLGKELNISNSLELCILYSYLLWHGYLSKNKEYKFSSNNRKLITGLFFADIMDGRGVCLDNSEMLKDFLNLCEYNCVMLENRYNLFTKLNYKININTESEEEVNIKIIQIIESICKSVQANHVFNLIEDNDGFYIFDSTNLLLQGIINMYSSKLINGEGRFKLFPYKSYMLCASHSEIELLDKFIRNPVYISPYQNSDLIAVSEVLLQLLNCSKSLLEDFYNEIIPNINIISEETDKIIRQKTR